MAAAMHAGVPLKLSGPVHQVMNGGEFPPDLDAQKRAMTLEDLLTMSVPLLLRRHQRTGAAQRKRDVGPDRGTRFLPLHDEGSPGHTAGPNAVYCSAIPNLALGIAGRAANENSIVLFGVYVSPYGASKDGSRVAKKP